MTTTRQPPYAIAILERLALSEPASTGDLMEACGWPQGRAQMACFTATLAAMERVSIEVEYTAYKVRMWKRRQA